MATQLMSSRRARVRVPPPACRPISASIFARVSQIAYQNAGIDLKPGKESLVLSRIGKRIRALALSDEREYLDYLEGDRSGEEMVQFLDVISTNFTSFMREPDHFTYLTERVEEWMAAGQDSFTFWSAASSSGEEPYSLAITLFETLSRINADAKFKILATDISTAILARARAGVYPDKTLAALPGKLRQRWFRACAVGDGQASGGVVKAALRERITFKRLNLSAPPFPMQGPFDGVFCRNVMIYFDQSVRQRLVNDICRLVKPGGFLITGHSESISGMDPRLYMVRPSVYCVRSGAEFQS